MPSTQVHARKRVGGPQHHGEQQHHNDMASSLPNTSGGGGGGLPSHSSSGTSIHSSSHNILQPRGDPESGCHHHHHHHAGGDDQHDTEDPKEHKRSSLSSSFSEVRAAVTAVLSFLLVGLCLGFVLLHHQHRKVVLHVMRNPWAHGRAAVSRGRVGFHHHFYSGAPRFVTVVLPSVVNPPGRTRRLTSIQHSWGPFARAIFVVHNATSEFPAAKHAMIYENHKPEDPYAFPQLLLVPPDITFDDGLPRLNYVIRTVLQRVNPDFAFFVNDHTFVIPEHLCRYLEKKDPKLDMYAGHALRHDNIAFNSGAAGYILSRSTMQKLVQKWDENDSICVAASKGNKAWLQGNPGLVSAQCLHDVLNIPAIDTRKAKKWHRFHAYPLTRLVSGKFDDWYVNKHKDLEPIIGVDETYSTVLSGEDCCSEDSISFHYVEYLESKSLFATRSALLKDPFLTEHELKSIMKREWPTSWSDVGGYSKPLPDDSDEETWKALLAVMRKISSRHTQRDC